MSSRAEVGLPALQIRKHCDLFHASREHALAMRCLRSGVLDSAPPPSDMLHADASRRRKNLHQRCARVEAAAAKAASKETALAERCAQAGVAYIAPLADEQRKDAARRHKSLNDKCSTAEYNRDRRPYNEQEYNEQLKRDKKDEKEEALARRCAWWNEVCDERRVQCYVVYVAPPADERHADATRRQNKLDEEIEEAHLFIRCTEAGVVHIAPPAGETHTDAAHRRSKLGRRCTFKEQARFNPGYYARIRADARLAAN